MEKMARECPWCTKWRWWPHIASRVPVEIEKWYGRRCQCLFDIVSLVHIFFVICHVEKKKNLVLIEPSKRIKIGVIESSLIQCRHFRSLTNLKNHKRRRVCLASFFRMGWKKNDVWSYHVLYYLLNKSHFIINKTLKKWNIDVLSTTIMVFLREITINDLRRFSLDLSSRPVDTQDQCEIIFDIFGTVKEFDEERVRFLPSWC